MKTNRTLLVSSHSMVRVGMRVILTGEELGIAEEAGSIQEAEERVARGEPRLVVLDACEADQHGLDGLWRLGWAAPQSRIVVISDRADELFVEQALLYGASAYVLSETASVDLVLAVRAALKGREFFSPRLIQKLEGVANPGVKEVVSGPECAGSLEAFLGGMIRQGAMIKQLAQTLRANIEWVRNHHPSAMIRQNRGRLIRLLGAAKA